MLHENVVRLSEFAALKKTEKIPTGVEDFDQTVGGLVHGGVCQLFGKRGSGKRSVVMSLLASFTSHNHICAVVDASNSFDPVSAKETGINLDRIFWVRCDDDPQKAILATDYLIQSRLFRAIWLDMSLCETNFLRRMPTSYWFRFKVGMKDYPGHLLVTLEEDKMRSACQQSIYVKKLDNGWEGDTNFRVMRHMKIDLEPERG